MKNTAIPSLLSDQLQKIKVTLAQRKKYIKNEFQSYGLELAKELHDWKNRSLYIRLVKNTPRPLIDQARYFVKDQTTGTIKSPARLFMWKLKQLKT